MKKIMTIDISQLPGQPPQTDDEQLHEAFPDERGRQAIIKAFRIMQNQIIDLQNTVNGTNKAKLTMAEARAWFRGQFQP